MTAFYLANAPEREPMFAPLKMAADAAESERSAVGDRGAAPGGTGGAPKGPDDPDRKKKRRRIVLAIIVAILIILLLLLSQCGRCSNTQLAPSLDGAAQDMRQPEEKMEADEGGGAVNITYSGAVQIDLASKTAAIHVENPARSTHDMVVELVIANGGEDVSVAKSGLLPAGYQLSTLDLADNVELQPGSYEGCFLISFYDPDSKEQAYANTKMDLDSVTAS